MTMQGKEKLPWKTLAIVCLCSIIDYQGFIEAPWVATIPAGVKGAVHLMMLLCILLAGDRYLKSAGAGQAYRKIWVWSYIAVICMVVIFGIEHHYIGWLSQKQNFHIKSRLWFATPVPFLVLLVMLRTARSNF